MSIGLGNPIDKALLRAGICALVLMAWLLPLPAALAGPRDFAQNTQRGEARTPTHIQGYRSDPRGPIPDFRGRSFPDRVEKRQQHMGPRAGGDHDNALRALRAGEVLPLAEIKRRIGRNYPGRVVRVQLLERRRAGPRPSWIYSMRILSPKGNVTALDVDAGTGRILRARGQTQGQKRGQD